MENENVVDEFDAGFLNAPATLTETPELDDVNNAPVGTPKMAQITEEQFNNLQRQLSEIGETTNKKFDTAFGKMGGIERVMNQLQSSTPSGEQVNISTEDFAELASEYPEIAQYQIAGLNKVLSKLKGTGQAAPAFDQAALDQMVEQRLGSVKKEMTQEFEAKSLNYMREDWKTIVGVPDSNNVIPDTEFRKWLGKQDSQYQHDVNNAWDAGVIHNAIRKFEGSTQGVQNNHRSDRQRQLQAAANTPRSSGGHPSGPSEDDEFDAGFRS